MSPNAPSQAPTLYQRWQKLSAQLMRGFHAYATWLVGMSWKRFILLSILTLIAANIIQNLLPSWRITETVEPGAPHQPKVVKPAAPKPPALPKIVSPKASGPIHYEVTIDERGFRVVPREPAKAASAPASAASDSAGVDPSLPSLEIRLPKSLQTDEVRDALEKARDELEDAVRQAQEARQEAEAARQEAEQAREEAESAAATPRTRVTVIQFGDFIVDLAVLLVVASAIIKASYKGRFQAEVKAAQAAETAEAESLRRQVVEARMAAMQAQVEPHFLFNTLASIDHLIETDPPRASAIDRKSTRLNSSH